MNLEEKYVEIIDQICDKSSTPPGKKMIQKLMYLIERKGVELNLNYRIHFYGPYSTRLDNELHSLESQDIISIDTSKPTHFISVNPAKRPHVLAPAEQALVDAVLEHFIGKTASELEALTTLDYAARQLLPPGASEDEVICEVKKIKGTKFTEEMLAESCAVLRGEGFLS